MIHKQFKNDKTRFLQIWALSRGPRGLKVSACFQEVSAYFREGSAYVRLETRLSFQKLETSFEKFGAIMATGGFTMIPLTVVIVR